MKRMILAHATNRTIMVFSTIFCLVLSLIPANAVFADANQFFLRIHCPTSQSTCPAQTSVSLKIGEKVTFDVKSLADADEPYGTANGVVGFPSSLLAVVGSPSTSGSGYDFSSSPSVGSGTISFNGTRSPADSGSALIFTVTFKALKGGTATVKFNSGTVNGESTTYGSGVVTISNPNPPSSSTPPKSSSPPKTSPTPYVTSPKPTPSSSSEPIVTPDPTGLIDDVGITPLYGSATVVWKVNGGNSAIPTLSYGTSTTDLNQKATVLKKADGTYQSLISDLSPGTRYIFSIGAVSKNGDPSSYTSSIFTRGYPVTITVTENNSPVQSGQIQIGTITTNINSNGKATVGLAAGAYKGTITTDTSSLSIDIKVVAKSVPSNGDAPETQSFSYAMSGSGVGGGADGGVSVIAFIVILIVGTIILGVGFAAFIAYRRKRFDIDSDGNSYSSTGPSVIIDDGYKWQDPDKR